MPFGSDSGKSVITGHSIINVKQPVPAKPSPSVAMIMIGKLPISVGIPESVPSEKVMPWGRVPINVNV